MSTEYLRINEDPNGTFGADVVQVTETTLGRLYEISGRPGLYEARPLRLPDGSWPPSRTHLSYDDAINYLRSFSQ